MAKAHDITGQRFGRLVAMRIEPTSSIRTHWHCECDCGRTHIASTQHLRRGAILSCGCLKREKTSARSRKHGATLGRRPSRLYTIWQSMRQRCLGPNCENYPRYGGRGIRICPEWSDFSSFMQWAFANGYSDILTIDRIDNDGNYEPANCRWATRKQQNQNYSRNRRVTYRGETACLSEHVARTNLKYHTVKRRLLRGWSINKALETPPRRWPSQACPIDRRNVPHYRTVQA